VAVAPQRQQRLLTFLANFTHTLALLLWFAAGLSFAAGIPELGAAIVAVVVVNGAFAYVQEYRAERIVISLMRQVAVHSQVVRDGRERRVAALDLVPGDLVRLGAGDVAAADCILCSSDNLTLDLSAVTGESIPVACDAAPTVIASERAELGDVPCITPAGAAVVTGHGEAVVFATGASSTMGRVAAMVEGVTRGRSVLEQQVAGLSGLTAVIAVVAGAATLTLAAAATDVKFVAALTFATGVIVALVPEGLWPTLSVSLAIGARRMAERGAAVRRLSAVETVGAVTVICTDKTGTLTRNVLSVAAFVPAGDDPHLKEEALMAAVLCNDARVVAGAFEGDPLDVALARWTQAQGRDVEGTRAACVRKADLPFDAKRRFMSVTCDVGGEDREFIKGAPEAVLQLAGVEASPAIASVIEEATGAGQRVLMLAARGADAEVSPLGVVRLFDPPRREVPEAIAACRRASVRVVMLTGDHASTARSVARDIGLGDVPVIEGAELDRISDHELIARFKGDVLFARIDPGQKLRIVTALRRAGEVVVVTGDGINDAPALRAADVGVAMGIRGTEVAKQAADIVLADDNFATIVGAIEEGRSIKQNIRRFASYVFSSNVAELAPFLVYIFTPISLPLAVAQVLAIDLGTDLVPALALGVERPSRETMDEAPEPPTRPLLTRSVVLRTFLFFGLVEAVLGIAAHMAYLAAAGWRPFDSFSAYSGIAAEARTLTFLGIVAGQIGCLFAQREGSLRARLSLFSNTWIAAGLAFELALTLSLVYVPGLNELFSMRAVAAPWLLVLPLGAACFVLADLVRRLVLRVRR
jgi:calcium-translocating P-type ATPase